MPFMIGITVDTGDGSCFAVPAKGRQYVNRTRYDNGEYGVAVRWLSRLAEDPEQRTFELDNNSEQFIFNSTELRAIDVGMTRARAGPTPVRPVTRSGHSGRGGLGRGVRGRKFTLPVESEQAILQLCW